MLHSGASTLSIGGKIVLQNSDHRIPDRLKVIFSNFIYEQPFNYLHDCDRTDENIYPDKTFKIEWPTVPVAFDNVTPTPLKVNDIFPRHGTSLKDNYILVGRIVGVFDDTLNCQKFEEKYGPNAKRPELLLFPDFISPFPVTLSGPTNEAAYADRYRVFYKRGSMENLMVYNDMRDVTKSNGNWVPKLEDWELDLEENLEKITLLDKYRRQANRNDFGCKVCNNHYGCRADWLSQIPEGFSCAKAVASETDGCTEVYEPVDCSNLVVKVASRKRYTNYGNSNKCHEKYGKLSCPAEFMDDEALRNKNCFQVGGKNIETANEMWNGYWKRVNGPESKELNGTWVLRHDSV